MNHYYSHQQLVDSGKFSPEDLNKIKSYRGAHNRLGFGYQLIYVRVFNFFPKQKPLEIIGEALSFSALQLDVDEQQIHEYAKHRQHIARHQEHIRSYLGLAAFGIKASTKLCEFLFEEAQRIEQMTLLLAEAKRFLREQKILQPSDDTLQRLIIQYREKARQFIFSKLTGLLDGTTQIKLDQLLQIDETRQSKLQKLKRSPGKPSPKSMLMLTQKLDIIKDTEILAIDLSWLNNNYQRSLAKYVYRCSADRLRELQSEHRYTAIVCFLWQTSLDTVDYIIDMHSKLMTRLYTQAEHQIDAEMQKKRKNIKTSLGMLKTIGSILLDKTVLDKDLRAIIFTQVDREKLQTQITESESWLTGKLSHVFYSVVNRFSYLRQFTPAMLDHLQFEKESDQADSLIQSVNILRELNQDNKRKLPGDIQINFMPAKLQGIVAPQGNVDKHAWECALLTCLRDDIRAGNISVQGSKRYGHFSDFFIPVHDWKDMRTDFFKRARLPEKPEGVAAYFNERLNLAYDNFLAKQPENKYARVENDKWILSVDPAETLSKEETSVLATLQSWLSTHMRSIKLPQLLIEVDNDLHYTKEFTPSAKQSKREADDVCAILVTVMAHGCFIGPYTMARLTQGVSYEQIKRITDWQLTEDAQRAALAVVVNAISKMDVSSQWGEGKTSSSDGQRFELKRKSLQQTYSTRFGDFALEFYTFVADNYAPFYSTPIECTDRDAAYTLDGILYNESDLDIEEHYTDTHGFTEINFAAFAMLGKKFSPRIRGVQRQRIYYLDKEKDHGSLVSLLSANDRLIHMDWIVEQWDRIGQFYASLEKGHATASTALKRLVGFSEKNHFYRANRELGRIFKTENILEYMSDPLLRQKRRRGLLKGEQIHQLARDLAYGKRGKISVRDIQEQKNTCSCLTLILANIIYWQAKEIKRVIEQFGHEIAPICLTMLPHISPISWDNILLYGEYFLDRKLIR